MIQWFNVPKKIFITVLTFIVSKIPLGLTNEPPRTVSDSHKYFTLVDERVKHLQTQRKNERYRRSMNNVAKLVHYFCAEELIEVNKRFVSYYNNVCHHELLDNVTPADVYWGRKDPVSQRKNKNL